MYCIVLIFEHLLAGKNDANFPLMARIFMKRSLEKQPSRTESEGRSAIMKCHRKADKMLGIHNGIREFR